LDAAATGAEGVVLLGKGREGQQVGAGYKDQKSKLASAGHPRFSFSRQARVPDHYYFYLWDHQWGPAFLKLSPCAPDVVGVATDVRALRAVGVEWEMELPFAALQELCLPTMDRVDGLPAPQQSALRATVDRMERLGLETACGPRGPARYGVGVGGTWTHSVRQLAHAWACMACKRFVGSIPIASTQNPR
jgi:hypothetical protein